MVTDANPACRHYGGTGVGCPDCEADDLEARDPRCDVCGLEADPRTHPCRFGKPCSCWWGVPCQRDSSRGSEQSDGATKGSKRKEP